MDRIEFENSNAVERSERIHEADKARGDKRRQNEDKRARAKIGKNLDIEA